MITAVKRSSSDAIEFLEAKKPLVVENRPTSASAKTGRPIKGARKIVPPPPNHLNAGSIPARKLFQKSARWKSLVSSSSRIIPGWLIALITNAVIPAIIIILVKRSGNFGKLLNTKRRCGCRNTKIMQNDQIVNICT